MQYPSSSSTSGGTPSSFKQHYGGTTTAFTHGTTTHYASAPSGGALGKRDPNATAAGTGAQQQPRYGRSVKPIEADVDIGLRAARAPEATAVTALQFSGLTMHLEVERAKREDADRLLREEMTIQFGEVRDAVKAVARENAALKEQLADLRRASASTTAGATAGSDAGPSSLDQRKSAFRSGIAGAAAGGGQAAVEIAGLRERVDDLEARSDRHQRLFDERSKRVESAVSEFCAAHISVEMERLRGVARETARGSVEEIVRAKTDGLVASWTDSFGDLERQLVELTHRSRDTVAAVKERVEGCDASIASLRGQVDQHRELLRGMGETRSLVASITALRAEHERHTAAFRERENERQAFEGRIAAEVRALEDALGDAKASLSSTLGKRIDAALAHAATRADMIAAIDRHGASFDTELRELSTAIQAQGSRADSLRAQLESRMKSVEASSKQAQHATADALAELRGSITDLSRRADAADIAIAEGAQHGAGGGGAAEVARTATRELEERLRERLTAVESLARGADNAVAAVKADVNDSRTHADGAAASLRSRVDALEQLATTARRVATEAKSDAEEAASGIGRLSTALDAEREARVKLAERVAQAQQQHEAFARTTESAIEEVRLQQASAHRVASETAQEAVRHGLADARTAAIEAAASAARDAVAQQQPLGGAQPVTEADVRRMLSTQKEGVLRDFDAAVRRAVDAAAEEQRDALARVEASLQDDIKRARRATADEVNARIDAVARTTADSLESVNASHASLTRHVDEQLAKHGNAVQAAQRNAERAAAAATSPPPPAPAATAAITSDERAAIVEEARAAAVDAVGPRIQQTADSAATSHRALRSTVEALEGRVGTLAAQIDIDADTTVTAAIGKRVARAEEAAAAAVKSVKSAIADLEEVVTSQGAAASDSAAATSSASSVPKAAVAALQRTIEALSERLTGVAEEVAEVSAEAAATKTLLGGKVATVEHSVEQLSKAQQRVEEEVAQAKQQIAAAATAASAASAPAARSASAASDGPTADSVQLEVDIIRNETHKLRDTVDALEHSISVLSRETAEAAAAAASEAFERYREEVAQLTRSFGSGVSSPSPARESGAAKRSGSSDGGDASWVAAVEELRVRVGEQGALINLLNATVEGDSRALAEVRRDIADLDDLVTTQRDVLQDAADDLKALSTQVVDGVAVLAQRIVDRSRRVGRMLTDDGEELSVAHLANGNEVPLAVALETMWDVISGTASYLDRFADRSVHELLEHRRDLLVIGEELGVDLAVYAHAAAEHHGPRRRSSATVEGDRDDDAGDSAAGADDVRYADDDEEAEEEDQYGGVDAHAFDEDETYSDDEADAAYAAAQRRGVNSRSNVATGSRTGSTR